MVDGRLTAGRLILVVRNLQSREFPDGSRVFRDAASLTIYYGDDWVKYDLIPNPLVWSDGPPHPDYLQLARRVACTDGVVEPGEVLDETSDQ